MKRAREQVKVNTLGMVELQPSLKVGGTRQTDNGWSIKTRVRLPHKIGQPLGSGGGSDGGSDGGV